MRFGATLDLDVDGGAATPCSPAGAPPAVHHPHQPAQEPRRAREDGGTPYQVALAAQDLLDLLLGDEPFDIAEAAPVMARLAAFTDEGHHAERRVWTRALVLARVAELQREYQVPPELGGDLPPAPGSGDAAGELAVAR